MFVILLQCTRTNAHTHSFVHNTHIQHEWHTLIHESDEHLYTDYSFSHMWWDTQLYKRHMLPCCWFSSYNTVKYKIPYTHTHINRQCLKDPTHTTSIYIAKLMRQSTLISGHNYGMYLWILNQQREVDDLLWSNVHGPLFVHHISS